MEVGGMNYLIEFLPLFFKGVVMTIQIFLAATFFSYIVGTLCGVFICNHLKLPLISSIIEMITFILRAVPFYVQLLIVYFVLPDLIGYNFNPFVASILALGMCSSGYIAQITRGGINSLHLSQWEAAYVLGLNKIQSFIYIIFPQTFKNVLPMVNNECDSILKSTAVTSSIGLLELTRVGMNIISREMQPIPIYLGVAFFYICLSFLLNLSTRYLERRFSYAKT